MQPRIFVFLYIAAQGGEIWSIADLCRKNKTAGAYHV